MKKLIIFTVSAIFLAILTFIIVKVARTQNQTADILKTVSTIKVSGEVLKIDSRKMTVQTNEGVKEIDIPPTIKITVNKADAQLEKVKPKDKVEIVFNEGGQILVVNVTSNNLFTWRRLIIPTIIILLVAILASWLSLEKVDQGNRIKMTIGD